MFGLVLCCSMYKSVPVAAASFIIWTLDIWTLGLRTRGFPLCVRARVPLGCCLMIVSEVLVVPPLKASYYRLLPLLLSRLSSLISPRTNEYITQQSDQSPPPRPPLPRPNDGAPRQQAVQQSDAILTIDHPPSLYTPSPPPPLYLSTSLPQHRPLLSSSLLSSSPLLSLVSCSVQGR